MSHFEKRTPIDEIDKVKPLITAIKKGDMRHISKILKYRNVDVNQPNSRGWTPLIVACEKGRADIVRLLLDAGANVNQKSMNKYEESPLSVAVGGCDIRIMKILLDKGASVNDSTSNGKTVLHMACWYGDNHIVYTLLEYGADVNATDNRGYTPLLSACERGNINAVRYLFQYGKDNVNINQKTNDGLTAQDLVRKWNDTCEEIKFLF